HGRWLHRGRQHARRGARDPGDVRGLRGRGERGAPGAAPPSPRGGAGGRRRQAWEAVGGAPRGIAHAPRVPSPARGRPRRSRGRVAPCVRGGGGALGARRAGVRRGGPAPVRADQVLRACGGACSTEEGAAMGRMTRGRELVLGVLVALVAAVPLAHAQKKTLVVALNQDLDILDPTLSQSYVGRIVYASMCEKLYEIDEQLTIVPQLAAEMPRVTDGGRTVTIRLRAGVKFNDGTPMNAEAVKFSLDRHREMK